MKAHRLAAQPIVPAAATATDHRHPATGLETPRLWCPIAPARHAAEQEVTDRTIEWMRRFDYIRTPQEESSARAARFGALGALTHPHGSLDGAVLAAQAMVWLFLQDDRFSERAPAQGRIEDLAEHILCCQRVLHGPAEIPEPPGRYPAALLDLRIRLAGMAADPEQVERFTDGFNRYLAAVAAEAIYRVRGVTPDLAQYIRLRESTILMRGMCFVLIELADDCYLPGPLWARPDVRRCERAAALAIAYTHDILSGLRELYWPGHVNLITALARHLDRPLADALAEAVRMCEEQMALFQRLAGPLAEEGDERLARYVRGMGAWIRGNLDWSMTCGRYHVSSPRPSGESPGMFGA